MERGDIEGRKVEGWAKLVKGTKRHKFPGIKQVSSDDVIYIQQGDYSQ